MKRLISSLMAILLIATGISGVAAQDATPAAGIGNPMTYVDDRGNDVATVQVTNINPDWTEYDEWSEPERGYVFRAVDFTVTNISDASMIVESFDFTLMDAYGRNNSSSWVTAAEDASMELFSDDVPLASGESADLRLVFETPADVEPAALIWQPDSGIMLISSLNDTVVENGAIAHGLSTPVTWTDDRGNAVATMEVSGIENDWQGYDTYSAPERGMMYVAVTVSVTNVSDASMIIDPYNFSLIDSQGRNNGRAWMSIDETSGETLFEEETAIAAGETYEGTIVYAIYSDLTPSTFLWQPDWGILHLVMLDEDGTAAAATPEASAPEEATAEATDETEATAEAAQTSPDNSAAAVPAQTSSTSSSATPTGETAVDGDPQVFVDALGKESGTIRVVSTLDDWDGYDDSQAPAEGTRFFLVTVEVESTTPAGIHVGLLDFAVASDNDGVYDADLFLNAPDAEVKITETGQDIEGESKVEITIPFIVPADEVPTSLIWDNGIETIELRLVP